MPCPYLPPEIVAAIITDVADAGLDRRAGRDLAACCLVSRDFLDPARAALYSHLHFQKIGDPGFDYNLVDWAQPDEGVIFKWDPKAVELILQVRTHAHLGRLVKSAHFASSEYADKTLSSRLVSLVITILLRCCPNLQDILVEERTVSGAGPCLDVIGALHPSLKALSIYTKGSIDEVTKQGFSGLISLEHLGLQSDGNMTIAPDGDTPPPFHLKSLILELGRAKTTPKILSYFAHSSAMSLETIKLKICRWDLDLSPFVHLTHIAFSFILPDSPPAAMAWAEGLALCLHRAGPQVRRVTLMPFGAPDHSETVLHLLHLLPSYLESLIVFYPLPIEGLLDYLHSSTSTSLRRFSVKPSLRQISVEKPGAHRKLRLSKKVIEAGAARGVIVRELGRFWQW